MWVFDAIKVFPDKVTPAIDFTNKAVFKCYVTVVKTVLYW